MTRLHTARWGLGAMLVLVLSAGCEPEASSPTEPTGGEASPTAAPTAGAAPTATPGGDAPSPSATPPPGSQAPVVTPTPGDGTPPAGPTPPPGDTPEPAYRCAEVDLPSQTLETFASRFDGETWPLMIRDVGGCAACHFSESGRLMTLGPTGSDTFYRLRAGGFLAGDGPGTLLARLKATDATSMPQGGPHWTGDEIGPLACLVDDLTAFDASGILAPDEEFPPNLKEPYDGPAWEGFDDTWLGFDALKGRIEVQLGDDWIRGGVDNFAVNIGLFGGVDFKTTFSPVRQPTADYLLGVDMLARDVCAAAADDAAGPFQGLDLDAPTVEEPPSALSYFDTLDLDPPSAGQISIASDGDPYGLLWSNGWMGATAEFPIDGEYTFTVWAIGDPAGLDLPHMELRIDGVTLADWDVPKSLTWAPYTATVPVPAGARYVAIWFTNDYCCTGGDRNLYVDAFQMEGPLPGTTTGAVGARDAARGRLAQVLERLLYRPAQASEDRDELAPLYSLLLEMEALNGDRRGAWASVCELLLHHPDFLFTRPPYFDVASPAEQERLILLRTALDLLNRPPTSEEWARYDAGEDRMDLVAEWLESQEFLDAYFLRARILFEASGTTTSEEPARLMTWLFLSDRPIAELLTADYTVNPQFQQRSRPDEHGPTGALTMPGYIEKRPGLPHYNYAARVLSDFMGYVFEVPPEIVDSRAGSTAATTVDPDSVCFTCHQLLTPLAHQRLRWDDSGHYRDVDDEGAPIDDSDRGMVEGYPYKGSGMAAFSAQAVRKERFIRRMINTQAEYLLGRPLRYDTDERDLYQALWDIADGGHGSFRDVFEALLESEAYTHPAGGRYEEGGR